MIHIPNNTFTPANSKAAFLALTSLTQSARICPQDEHAVYLLVIMTSVQQPEVVILYKQQSLSVLLLSLEAEGFTSVTSTLCYVTSCHKQQNINHILIKSFALQNNICAHAIACPLNVVTEDDPPSILDLPFTVCTQRII